MAITISITLLVIALISGLYAISPFENQDKTKKEETVLDKIGLKNAYEMKKYLYSKFISLTVFLTSIASVMAIYFLKG